MMENKSLDTICLHGGYEPQSGEPNVCPVCISTTFRYNTPEELARLFDEPEGGHIYSRLSNPTIGAFEAKMAALEGGTGALACASGMAAAALAVLNVAQAGDNIISMSTIYGGVYNLFNVTLRKYGIETRFVSPKASDEEIERLIDERTKVFFAETIANPAMVVFDFERYTKLLKKYGVLLMIDNTLVTPVLVRPVDYGANVVIYSTTKYLDGHAVAVGGLIVDGGNFEFKGNLRYKEFYTPDESYHGMVYTDACKKDRNAYIFKARLQMMRDFGACMSPFNAFLTNLGVETLHIRMKRHSENALKIAEYLAAHPAIEWVKYPGLIGDENHNLAVKYFEGGFSGMVTVAIKGGRAKAEDFIRNLKLIRQVTHIADSRTCVLHPASTTHRQLTDEDLINCGISDNLVRISVGLESASDLIADIDQALKG
ncbi:MAG: O-acetylhomoserine aminocarboxypropyltransferase/cysteine synthase family protein [Christensenellales bacterium]